MVKGLPNYLDGGRSSRQARLRAWLALHGIENRTLAREIGVHPSYITRLFKGERRCPVRIRQLIDLGIPAELLPEPTKRGRGRPRKHS